MQEQFSKELAEYILEKERTDVQINNKKISLCKKYSLKQIPLNSEILSSLPDSICNKVSKYLVVKGVRSKAGVNVIALMSPPHECPHGKCIYCPGGLDSGVPQSYTGFEPATMRAIANNYDPYKQVKNRINQLEAIGHEVSKLELIIMGGTFNSLDYSYQKEFVKDIYDAITDKKSKTLEQAKDFAEYSEKRCIGLTLETRPDFCQEENIYNALNLGATRIELGVQTLSESIYKKANRGHSLKDVVDATRLLKDSGFKVLYHMMPGLFANVKTDLKTFEKLFIDDKFKPDMLKIYPVLVMENTKLQELWNAGKYVPYTDSEFSEFLYKMYQKVPYWIRIMRVQRDIPSTKVLAGVLKSNMRDTVVTKLNKNHKKIKEIRFRELGLDGKNITPPYKIFVQKYDASKGKEFFISYETADRKTLIGFIRLRFPHNPFIKELKDNVALIRELHVYGNVVPVSKKSEIVGQHRGIGKMLLAKAEHIAKENGYSKVAVISGVGVREYYYKQGYFKDGFYVSKNL